MYWGTIWFSASLAVSIEPPLEGVGKMSGILFPKKQRDVGLVLPVVARSVADSAPRRIEGRVPVDGYRLVPLDDGEALRRKPAHRFGAHEVNRIVERLAILIHVRRMESIEVLPDYREP